MVPQFLSDSNFERDICPPDPFASIKRRRLEVWKLANDALAAGLPHDAKAWRAEYEEITAKLAQCREA